MEGFDLAWRVGAAVTIVTALVAMAGVVIDRIAALHEGTKDR